MKSSEWKEKTRKKQDIYWLHHRIKEELGIKKYNSLLSEEKINNLEKEVIKNDQSIYEIIRLLLSN